MTHIKYPTAEAVKKAVDPVLYYNRMIGGKLGKSTGNGWYSWLGLCPFHTDKNAGSVYINRKTGAFKCFSCGARGGDIFAFQMLQSSCSFPEAIEQVGGLSSCETV